MSRNRESPVDPASLRAQALAVVSEALAHLNYGAIQLTVHDGKVLQVDVTEKKRLGA